MKINKNKLIYSLMHVLPILCVLLLLLLQYGWFLNAFDSTSKDLMEKCKTSLREAVDIETFNRYDKKNLTVDFQNDYKNTGNEILATGSPLNTEDLQKFLYETLYLIGSKTNIYKVDSLFRNSINKKLGFIPKYKIKIENDYINLNNFQEFGIKKSDTIKSSLTNDIKYDSINFDNNIIIARLNSAQVIKMDVDPKSVIYFKEIRRLFFTSIFIVVFVIIIIILQIRSLNKEHLKIKFLKEYTNAVTHDMQTPLNNIIYVTDMLKMGNFDKNKELRDKYYKLFKEQSEKQIRSIHRLLLMAKEERGELVLSKRFVNIFELVNEIICYYKESVAVQNKSVTFNFKCDPQNFEAYIDKDKFEIVFYNMIDNAIKYSYESVNIDIDCWQEREFLKIKISDNGMGITTQDLDEIFKNFNRGSKVERSSIMGYGIGLSFVKKVVKAHKGEITVTSKEQLGTEFQIIVPIS